MKEKEHKLANIGCSTLVIILVVIFILIPKPKTPKDFAFETVSSYDAGKNAKVQCIYTDCKDFEIIKSHAYNQGAQTDYSLVIFYFNNRKKIPDISKTGFVIDDKDHQKAIATYKKYGKKTEKFTIQ